MESFGELGPLAWHAARGRSLGTLFSLAAAVALAGVLGACGGGGGDPPAPPPPPPPAPSPTPSAPIAAQLTVPTPVGYDTDRLAAFNRLNEIRLSAGLGMLAQNVLMDQAAQAHADWMIANNSFTHEEQEGTPGFTGVDWPHREEVLGYVPIGGYEVISGASHGAAGVDVLVNGVYHRVAILAFEPVDVGIGWSAGVASNVSMPLVIDVTRPGADATRALGQAAQASINGAAVWPIDGALNVPLRLGLESPNPVPSQNVLSLGTPVSVTVDRFKTISGVVFMVTSVATGAVVPTQVLTYQNDPGGLIPGSYVAAIPLGVLNPNTTFRVDFSGSTLDALSGNSGTINRSWSFTTAAQ